MASPLIKNVSSLLSAGVLAQVVGLLVYPLITRLYGSEEFGMFNLFLSVGGLIAMVSTGQYEYAVVRPRNERAAVWCVHCALCMMAPVLLLCVVMTMVPEFSASLLGAPQLAQYLWLMPIYVVAMALWAVLRGWLARHQRFDRISSYQIGQSVISAGAKVGMGFGGVAGGLIYGSVVAPLLSFVVSVLRLPKALWAPLLQTSWRGTKRAAHRYRNFPLWSMPKSLVDYLASNLPLLMLTPVFGLKVVGFLGMALTLAYRPISLIASSINPVLYAQSAQNVNGHLSIATPIRNYTRWVLLVGIPLFALLYLVLPDLCDWLLGDEWRETGHYLRLMLLWLLLTLISNAINFIPDVFDRQRGLLFFSIARLLFQAAALIIGVALHSTFWTILLYYGAGTLVLAVQLLWFRSIVVGYERSIGGQRDN